MKVKVALCAGLLLLSACGKAKESAPPSNGWEASKTLTSEELGVRLGVVSRQLGGTSMQPEDTLAIKPLNHSLLTLRVPARRNESLFIGTSGWGEWTQRFSSGRQLVLAYRHQSCNDELHCYSILPKDEPFIPNRLAVTFRSRKAFVAESSDRVQLSVVWSDRSGVWAAVSLQYRTEYAMGDDERKVLWHSLASFQPAE
jgi:hypothetical protein